MKQFLNADGNNVVSTPFYGILIAGKLYCKACEYYICV